VSYLVIEINRFPDEVYPLGIDCPPHIIFFYFFPTRHISENILDNVVAVVRIDAIIFVGIINLLGLVVFGNSCLTVGFLFRAQHDRVVTERILPLFYSPWPGRVPTHHFSFSDGSPRRRTLDHISVIHPTLVILVY
jgi:hypothetical protein